MSWVWSLDDDEIWDQCCEERLWVAEGAPPERYLSVKTGVGREERERNVGKSRDEVWRARRGDAFAHSELTFQPRLIVPTVFAEQ